ncbi:hypothetical protein ABWL39_02730 [Chitinivorax sp. PXF-14]|uniref:hypothetical protein n=1 Tax=Chitinivorax sp. PXF-14 TaxID=3230488 RepID=UPI0034650BDB
MKQTGHRGIGPRHATASLWLGTALLAYGLAARADDVPSPASRKQAASETAERNARCKAIQPFYWEIGDRQQRLAGGSVGGNEPDATTQMKIASASKWVFGAYVIELRGGRLSEADIRALTMRSGYTSFNYGSCVKLLPRRQAHETVAECFDNAGNNRYSAANDGRFFYDGGHFQAHAVKALDLGQLNDEGLAQAVNAMLGIDIGYASPQLAAGVETSATAYARFLQRTLSGELRIHDALGTHAVCTNPRSCSQAVSTPIPQNESWHYSIGHWVEDDPRVGDGAYSSPGAFGFYPWIDADKTYYGILARHSVNPHAGYESTQCGRNIRRAWLEGRYVPAS